MKQLLYFLLTGILLFSCSPPEESIMLRFNLEYNDEPLVMFSDVDYPDGRKMQFQRISFFISGVNVSENGSATEVSDVDFIDMTSSHSNAADIQPTIVEYFSDDYPDFDSINLTLGLSEEQNNSTPADFSSNSPLARSGEYWPSWNSYVFVKLEGNIDLDGDGEYGGGEAFIFHLGSTETARDISLPVASTQQEIIDFSIDVEKIFQRGSQIYDIDDFQRLEQLSDDHISRMNWMMDNLAGAISIN